MIPAAFFFLGVLASPAFADTNTMTVTATYLAEPTDWCAAEDGLPILYEIDGPTVYLAPREGAGTIAVRRGTSRHQIEVRRSDVPTRRPAPGINLTTGKFTGTVRACQSPFSMSGTGTWHVTGETGVLTQGESNLRSRAFIGDTGPFFSEVWASEFPWDDGFGRSGTRLNMGRTDPEIVSLGPVEITQTFHREASQ